MIHRWERGLRGTEGVIALVEVRVSSCEEGVRSLTRFPGHLIWTMIRPGGVSVMPAPKSPEFRRRALDLVAQGNPVAQVARDLGSPSRACAGGWNATMSMPAARRA
jgi:hypothetical protein